jgi:hypothetical protein
MNRNLPGCVSAAMLGAAIVAATPAMARGGFGGGGGHFGAIGGSHFGGFGGHFGGFGPRFTGRSVAIGRFDRDGRFGRSDRDDRFFFRHHRFRNFAFFGVPFAAGYGYDYGYGECFRPIWTGYGYRWANVCSDYGYYGY